MDCFVPIHFGTLYYNQFKLHTLLKNFLILFQEKLGLLLDAVKNKDEAKSHHFKKTEEWATVEEMMAAHGQ